MAVVEVEGLVKSYHGRRILDAVDLVVEEGEIFGILGPNGAGKTTLVETMQGLRRPDTGRVQALGWEVWAERGRLRRRVGSQLQASSLPARMRPVEAVVLFARLSGHTHVDPEAVLEEWGLGEAAQRPFAVLSGGQRQRLFIALALLGSPEVVFLDELTTGLDPEARRATWRHIASIRSRGVTVVLVTHFMDEAEALCDRVAVLHRGRIVASGVPGEVAGEEVALTFSTRAEVGWLAGLGVVSSVERTGSKVRVGGNPEMPALVVAALVERGIVPVDLEVGRPRLEDAYLRLTGAA